MLRVSKTELAEQDLDDIWIHIAIDNPEAADRVLDEIDERCKLLAQHKEMGRDRPELATGLRSFPVGRFIVYYRPDADGIELVRVLGAARDAEALFPLDPREE